MAHLLKLLVLQMNVLSVIRAESRIALDSCYDLFALDYPYFTGKTGPTFRYEKTLWSYQS